MKSRDGDQRTTCGLLPNLLDELKTSKMLLHLSMNVEVASAFGPRFLHWEYKEMPAATE